MKQCGKCKELKPFVDFYKANTKTCGFGSYCKRCQHEHYKQRYHYRTKVLKMPWQPFKDQYKQRNRRFVFRYLLSHPCVDCGEADPVVLDFDHVRGTKRANLSFLIARAASVKTLRAEIDKCEVRCANCHRRRTAVQFNWLSRRTSATGERSQERRMPRSLELGLGPEYSCLVLAPLAQLVEQ